LFILQDLSFSIHKLGRVYTSGTGQMEYFPSGTGRLKIDISRRKPTASYGATYRICYRLWSPV